MSFAASSTRSRAPEFQNVAPSGLRPDGWATGSGTNVLVTSVVTDFSSGEGRSAARDGLKTKFANSTSRLK